MANMAFRGTGFDRPGNTAFHHPRSCGDDFILSGPCLFLLSRFAAGHPIFHGLCDQHTASHVFPGIVLIVFITFTLPFGIAFELPIVLIVLGRLGIIDVTFLKRKQKAFIVIAFIFAAVISPTGDIFTQTMIAIPMIILYELSILFMRL